MTGGAAQADNRYVWGNEHGLGDHRDILVFHAYDSRTGHPYLQISPIDWTGEWPHVALEGGNSADQ